MAVIHEAPIRGISQARILKWVAISFSRGSSQPRDRTLVSYTAGRLFTIWDTRESESESEVAQSCPTLSDPMDCSLLGSSIHGIFQARVLEWGAIAFSRDTREGPLKQHHTGARASYTNF